MTQEVQTYKYTCQNDWENLSIFLQEVYGYSSRLLRRIKKTGKMTINGKDCWLSSPLTKGDMVRVDMPQEEVDVEPVYGDIDILYEDDEVICINKDAFCVTHPTKRHQLDTLANFVAAYYIETKQRAKIRFVNRIDRDTTGIVVIAKNKYVHHFVQSEKKIDKVIKKYIAFVHGCPKTMEGCIDAPIEMSPETGIERIVCPEGKPSITHYRVIETYGKTASKLELILETGRTHQIRVHLRHVGLPIIGDPMYGIEDFEDFGMKRQALHAAEMILEIPKKGKLYIKAPFKADMKNLEKKLLMNEEEHGR